MKLRLHFNKLVEKLEDVSTVVEDTMLDESVKNIIFKLGNKSLTLAGYNPRAICRTILDPVDVETEFSENELPESGVIYFQIKAKELNTFLNTFKGLKQTEAEMCEFETFNNRIRLNITEVPKDAEKEYLRQTSRWIFDTLPVKDYIIEEINTVIDGSKLVNVASDDVLLYLSSLMPLLQNNGGDNLPSKIHFSNEYVFTVSNFATLFENILPEAFHDIVLTYSSVSFLKKVVEKNEVIFVGKTDTHLIIRVDDSEAFLRFQTKMPDHTLYVNSFKKDHAVVIDRQYFKDVLRRFTLVNEAITFEVKPNENVITLNNTKSTQDIPLLQTKNMESLEGAKFKLAWQILSKAIIGDDAVFSEQLFLYILPNPKSGYTLVFSDNSGKWFSLVQVR